jgi:hypothetical protein
LNRLFAVVGIPPLIGSPPVAIGLAENARVFNVRPIRPICRTGGVIARRLKADFGNPIREILA